MKKEAWLLIRNIKKTKDLEYYKSFNLDKKSYALITIHRPSNVDEKEDLLKIVEILNYVGNKIKIIFPIHPRTKKNLVKHNLLDNLKNKDVILFVGIFT